MTAAAAVLLTLASSPAAVREAEVLAAAALVHAASRPDESLADARRALALTAEFEPTVFVKAGRKGEVVEDEFVQARQEYRRHRAGLYEAVGECLFRKGDARAASRYLGRAVTLHATPPRVARLARALVTAGRPAGALDVLHRARLAEVGPEMAAVFEETAEAAGLPSSQVEIDRMRLASLGSAVQYRDGPVTPPAGTRVSTGAPLDLASGVTVLFVSEASCRTCSQDLQALRRAVAPETRVVIVPEDPENDHALRQVMSLYRYDWPVVLGKGVMAALGMSPRSVLVVARGGWVAASVAPPFAEALPAVLKTLARKDLVETIPMPSWSRRPPDRRALTQPALLPEGLAPGEDEPQPPEFAAAVAAFRAGRAAEARRGFEALEARGDGWLLPPETRLNRGLCLAAMGRRDEARRLLLRIGDSRFQDAVDRALEAIGSPAKP